ncbi:hypothetical protein [Thiomonas sp.]
MIPENTNNPGIFWTEHLQLVGRSGVGKSTAAAQLVLARLVLGRPVVILDYGRSYLHLARLLHGNYIDLRPEQQYHQVSKGDCSLFVYDFESLWLDRGAKQIPTLWKGDLPEDSSIPGDLRDGLVIVDEPVNISPVYPALLPTLAEFVQRGASIAVTGQCPEDVEPFRPVLKNARLWDITSSPIG